MKQLLYVPSDLTFFHINKSKVLPRTGHEGPEEEQMYTSTLPSTSALDGLGGQRHAPAALPPAKTRYPLYRRLGVPQGRSGRGRKISPPTWIRSPDRPFRSESVYRLSYPDPFSVTETFTFIVKLKLGGEILPYFSGVLNLWSLTGLYKVTGKHGKSLSERQIDSLTKLIKLRWIKLH